MASLSLYLNVNEHWFRFLSTVKCEIMYFYLSANRENLEKRNSGRMHSNVQILNLYIVYMYFSFKNQVTNICKTYYWLIKLEIASLV
jgi:hypothetical protein